MTVGRRETLSDVVGALRKAKLDDRVEGVILMPPLGAGLWAKAQEIRDAMLDFRESGKPLIAYLEYGGGQQYYLATAADRIFLTPTSPLDLVGVASYELFLREAMDKVGTYPDYLHAGEFKTASNIYTETTFTPEHREMSGVAEPRLLRAARGCHRRRAPDERVRGEACHRCGPVRARRGSGPGADRRAPV